MAKSDFEPRKLETFDWISADVYAASKALLDKGGVNVQSCEVNEGETMLMQIAIDWIDPAIAQDGRIIGLDLDYGDWLGAAESVEGALEKPNGTPGKPHLYFSQNNFENWGDDASANAPMVLSDIPADMDEAVAALKEMLDAIPDAADITLEDEEGVALVRALYDELSKELTEEQKAQLARQLCPPDRRGGENRRAEGLPVLLRNPPSLTAAARSPTAVLPPTKTPPLPTPAIPKPACRPARAAADPAGGRCRRRGGLPQKEQRLTQNRSV